MKPLGWSRDGRSIYVVRTVDSADLLLMNAETGESRVLMKLPVGIIGDGAASRDGRTLVVSVRKDKATRGSWIWHRKACADRGVDSAREHVRDQRVRRRPA